MRDLGTQFLATRWSFQVAPVGAEAQVGNQGHIELDHAFHLGADQLIDFFGLVAGNVEEQFVVHLENHARLEIALPDFAVERDHGQLDEVGGGALEGRVDRGALGESARIGVAALDIGNGAKPAEEGAHTAFAARGSRVFSMKACTPW